jgi:hypothetical protein
MVLIINLLASAVMLGISFHCAPRSGYGAHFYPASIPTMVQAGLGCVVALAGLVSSRRRHACLVVSSVCLAGLGVPALFALLQGPEGDGGLEWLFVGGAGCYASLITGIATMLLGRKPGREEKLQKEIPSPIIPDASPASSQNVSVTTILQGDRKQPCALPPGRILWPIIGLAWAYAIWCAVGAFTWTSTRVTSYAGGIRIRCTDLHELCPYPYPFFYHVAPDREQVLLVDGQPVTLPPHYEDLLFPSPTGDYVATEDSMFQGPIRIYAVRTGKWTEVTVDNSSPEFPRHPHDYPFTITRWDSDGTLLIGVGYHDCHQVWRVAAATGERTRVE